MCARQPLHQGWSDQAGRPGDQDLHALRLPITRAGAPAAIEYSGISSVTTLPAPITQPFRITTPGRTITSKPNQTSSSIVIGVLVIPCSRIEISVRVVTCAVVTILVPAPIIALLPIESPPLPARMHPGLIVT